MERNSTRLPSKAKILWLGTYSLCKTHQRYSSRRGVAFRSAISNTAKKDPSWRISIQDWHARPMRNVTRSHICEIKLHSTLSIHDFFYNTDCSPPPARPSVMKRCLSFCEGQRVIVRPGFAIQSRQCVWSATSPPCSVTRLHAID